jgi:hypothetical protein
MTNPLLRVLSGLTEGPRIVDSRVPRRTFDDVLLPPSLRGARVDVDAGHIQAENVAGVFRLAREQDAVLLFDEADGIASFRLEPPVTVRDSTGFSCRAAVGARGRRPADQHRGDRAGRHLAAAVAPRMRH